MVFVLVNGQLVGSQSPRTVILHLIISLHNPLSMDGLKLLDILQARGGLLNKGSSLAAAFPVRIFVVVFTMQQKVSLIFN
jgi:hypothetical protein